MIAVIAAIALTAQAPEIPSAPAPIEGLWTNPSASLIIAIAPCAKAMCGTVRWASAKARRDSAKGTPQLIGADLLTSVRPTPEGRWTGKLFIPDRNMRVKAKLKLTLDGRLQVSGCAIGRILCKSEFWSRAAEPLPALD